MVTGNRLMICLMTAVILACVIAAFVLEWNGRQGAVAFVGIAASALGALSPSALHQARAGAGDSIGALEGSAEAATEEPAGAAR